MPDPEVVAPLVTVVTVTYNSARYVRDAIESVLAQTYTNIEYIIADDCSTDETWNIIGEYNDRRIRAYCNEQNLREYPNRNKAIELATGKYLIFIDGDDIIFPHGVGFFVRMMEAFPEAGMAIQKNYFNNLLYPALFQPGETLRNHFYGKQDLLSSSLTSDFFKTDLLKQWKFQTRFTSGDDEIRLRIAIHHPVLFVAGWVSWPRETPGQASSRINVITGIQEAWLYSREILNSGINKDLDPAMLEDIPRIMKKKLARCVLRLVSRGRLQEAKNLLLETGLSWNDVMKYSSYKTFFSDPLIDYTTINPFRRGFLKE